jgi:hypothetical protein
MIASLVWKEYREQRSVWAALALVSVLALVGSTWLLGLYGLTVSRDLNANLQSLAILLAWTHGMVCGALLLANEREGETLSFLDQLPMTRGQLWRVKYLSGAALTLSQIVVLLVSVLAMQAGASAVENPVPYLLELLASGLFGLTWGMLFSAFTRNVLNAIGLALGTGIFVYPVLALPLGAVLSLPANDANPVFVGLVVLLAGVLIAGPLAGSALIFTRPERLRRAARSQRAPARRTATAGPARGWRVLFWLTWRQMRVFALVLLPIGLLLGLALSAVGLYLWPPVTLLVGLLCGVTAFQNEQEHGAYRFLGEQRFPLGRVWLVKVGLRFALAVAVALLVLLPGFAITAAKPLFVPSAMHHEGTLFQEVFRIGPNEDAVQPAVFLPLWLLYGFSAGHVCGLVFRRGFVGLVVGLMLSLAFTTLWVPSVFLGGLSFWQVAGVPLVLLATGRLLMQAWTAERLLERGPVLRLAGGSLAAILWMAGGLVWRVVEVPAVPDKYDLEGFIAALPSVQDNDAGALIKTAASRVADLQRPLRRRIAMPVAVPVPGPVAGLGGDDGTARALQEAAWATLERGWPAEDQEVGPLLDTMFADDWVKRLTEAADLPLGLVEDPRRTTAASSSLNREPYRYMAVLLAARGLQQQAKGDNAVFVEHLRIGLSLSRNLRNRSRVEPSAIGLDVERLLLQGLERWLERLDGQPELLGRALDVVRRHEAETPSDPWDTWRAELLVALNTAEEPQELLLGRNRDDDHHATNQLLATSMLLPWEQMRTQRLVRLLSQADRNVLRKTAGEVHPFVFNLGMMVSARGLPLNRALVGVRAAELMLALRLHQAETGRPAEALAQLVPKILPAVPLDPFGDGKAFHYRRSDGERIEWSQRRPSAPAFPGLPAPPVPGGFRANAPFPGWPAGQLPVDAPAFRLIPAGQGILWSVGEDKQDDDGRRQADPDHGFSQAGEDLIYLVPLPPRR